MDSLFCFLINANIIYGGMLPNFFFFMTKKNLNTSLQYWSFKYSLQFSSIAQLGPTLWDSMDCSMPGFPLHQKFPGLTQIHVNRVSDAIQPPHPLSSPFLPAFNLSQHQGLFKWVSSSHQVAKILEFPVQPSVLPMNIQDWFPLRWTGCISLQSKGLPSVFSNNTVQKHQFLSAQLSL